MIASYLTKELYSLMSRTVLTVLQKDDVSSIKRWVEVTHQPNKKDKNGQTLLHHAVAHLAVRVVRYLLSQGVNVDEKEENGYTPFHYLVRNSFYPHDGHTFAIMSIAYLLLDAGASPHTTNLYGYTPLHWAARHGCLSLAQILVSRGAIVLVQNVDGDTPLHLAAANGKEYIIDYFGSLGISMNVTNKRKMTPLHMVIHRQTETINMLVKYGADVNVRDDEDWTPLHQAAYYNRVKSFLALIASGADTSLKARCSCRQVPLDIRQMACAGRSDKIIKLLDQGWEIKDPGIE